MKKVLILLFAALSVTSVFGQIKAKQSLMIAITGVPQSEQTRINNSYPVSGAGYIEMWKIGKVRAAGLTEAALASNIAAKFKAAQIYSSPVFLVSNPDAQNEALRKKTLAENKVAEAEAVIRDTKKITIGGQVKGPGQRQWTEGMTLYSAIQLAGGETPYGAINRVKLFRNGKVYLYNLKIDTHKGVKVYANDVIEVPEKNWFNK